MFEVGSTYNFRMIEGGDEVTFDGTVEGYDHPLVKIADYKIPESLRPGRAPGGDVSSGTVTGPIINVTSIHFISAVAR
tara:strand:- start:106 stop:339 length:234 start_codon:yes stop_codon:yes gene_type:complete